MIDKLTIVSEDMDFDALKREFGQTVTAKLPFNLYETCHKVSSTNGRHLFTAYKGPRTSNMRSFKLELNPSKLKLKYTSLMDILSCGMDTDKATIQRIDLASDVEMPVLAAFETVRIKHKRSVRSHADYEKGELTGFYIGSKLEQALIYNKACDPKGSKFKPSKALSSLSHLTRFEIRHHSKKVPFKKLSELPMLLGFNPYEKFEVLQLNSAGHGFSEFKKQNKVHGFQNSFMKLNKQNNFRRDVAKYFDTSTLPSQLVSNYRDNLGQFFGECA